MLRNLPVVFTKKPRAAKPAEPMIVFAVRYLTNQAHTDFDCTVLRQSHEKQNLLQTRGLTLSGTVQETPHKTGVRPTPQYAVLVSPCWASGTAARAKLILRASNQNGRHGEAFPIAYQINTDRIPRGAVANCCHQAGLAVNWLAVHGQHDVTNQHTRLLGR